jgi:hypothetical protein
VTLRAEDLPPAIRKRVLESAGKQRAPKDRSVVKGEAMKLRCNCGMEWDAAKETAMARHTREVGCRRFQCVL